MARKRFWAAVNVVGPKGELIKKDQRIPDSWSYAYVQSLAESGGATDVEPEES